MSYIYTPILHKAMTRRRSACSACSAPTWYSRSHFSPETSCPVAKLQRNVLGIRQFYKASTKKQ